jgi:cell shape-determining protein MreC
MSEKAPAFYLEILEKQRKKIEQLERENEALRELVEFQASNHQEEVWERVTKAYLAGQKTIGETE